MAIKHWLMLVLVLGCLPVLAQETEFRVKVEVDSALIRERPEETALLAASAFEDQILEAVGRNLDGRWFQVRRPGRLNVLGWIYADIVSYDFAPEKLPLTDLRTGLQGPVPLAADTGFAAFINESVVLRTRPYYEGERIIGLPYGVVVPVLERDPTDEWLHVNYLGYDGWIIGFTTRRMLNLSSVPVNMSFRSPLALNVVVIPPEVQRAQIARLREFIQPRLTLAQNLSVFWELVYRGQIMPCTPPDFETNFAYSVQDLRELPEFGRYVPRINQGITYLNTAIETLKPCGEVSADEVLTARNAATNARIIFEEGLKSLDRTEAEIR